MKANLLIAHGGGPTAVINASLYGAVMEAKKHPEIDHIYGAVFGSAGILAEQFVDLGAVPQQKLELLLSTPGTAIGTSRTPLEAEDYAKMAAILEKHNIRYALFNGGNGSMDTCGKLGKACQGTDIKVVGIPKTIDNDLAVIDHAPGFGSAARYLAASVSEAAQDVKGMPIHVCIIEAMGRNAGWITAASALARKNPGDAPHLIYLPERPFDEEEFLEDVAALHKKLGGVVVVASEGLKGRDGKPIVPPIFTMGRATYYGDVSAYLAQLVIKRLGIKARSEKPGIIGRASSAFQSPVDRDEAAQAGAAAVCAALEGKTGVMSGLRRISTDPYLCQPILVPIQEVMLGERVLPEEYITPRGNDVTEAFTTWCRPLIGPELPEFVDLKP